MTNQQPLKAMLCAFMSLLLLAAYPTQAQFFNEVKKGIAIDRESLDGFGNAVDISGNYAIVGAEFEDDDENGLNSLSTAGSAYIFERNTSNGSWSFVQKIVASDRSNFDQFGHDVAISGDYLVVSAHLDDDDEDGLNPVNFAGAAYIFQRQTDGVWTEIKKIVASDRSENDLFGFSVGIDSRYVVVGARYQDFNATGGAELFDAGAAYIFEKDAAGNWAEVQKITASDRAATDHYGISADISGNYAIVGAWQEDEDATASGTVSNAGSVYVYERDASGSWNEVDKLVANDRDADDIFGRVIDISGNFVIVGANHEDHDASGGALASKAGSAYIFERSAAGSWQQINKLVASDRDAGDLLGVSVSINFNYAIIGAQYESEDVDGLNTINRAGSAYIFERDLSGNWTEIQKITSADRGDTDLFGCSVAMGDQYALVAARKEDENELGGITLTDAGSVYFFEQSCPAPTNLITAIVNPTKVAMSWTHLITTQKYQLKGGPLSGGSIGQTIVSDNLVFVGGLTPGASYSWKVRARCLNLQISPFSEADTFSMTTLAAAKAESALLGVEVRGTQLFTKGEVSMIEVYDALGQLKLQQNTHSGAAVSLASLPAGIYFAVATGQPVISQTASYGSMENNTYQQVIEQFYYAGSNRK